MLTLVSLFLLTAVAGYSADPDEAPLDIGDFSETAYPSELYKLSFKYILDEQETEII